MKFEKGDILHAEDYSNPIGWIIVFKDITPSYTEYSVMLNRHQELVYDDTCVSGGFKLANSEQRQILFDALAKENKYYCKKTKTIKEMKKEFTKKDLKSGMWVELRNGEQHIVILNSVSRDDELLVDIISDKNGYLNLDNYSCSLNNEMYDAYDIMRVFNMHRGCLISGINTNSNLIWERETEEDKQIKEMQSKLDEMKKAYNELEKNISETLDKLNGLKK